MNAPLSVKELFGKERYSIPLYQRNFAWTFDEIGQLIIDILDSIQSNRDEYYIGTLVISPKDKTNAIIDGQQRFTALLLISLAIQNQYESQIKNRHLININLSFPARKRSDKTLKNLFMGVQSKEDDELSRGYRNVLIALDTYVNKDSEYKNISMDDFYEYLFNRVMLFISAMPLDLDLNLYFERFNSRGEQLEFHEIIKAELMQKMLLENVDLLTIKKFAKIWDACSEFDTPVISFFRKKAKCSDNDQEREVVFANSWSEYSPGNNSWNYGFEFDDIYSKIIVASENKRSIIDVINGGDISDQETDTDQDIQADEFVRYRSIVNFNTFLYYVLYLTDGKTPNEIQLDDKKLQRSFAANKRNKKWILRFGTNLLKMKFIFDNCIIRNSLETTGRRTEGDWFLQKAYRVDKNEKRRGHLYVQTRYDKNSFDVNNEDIMMLQSMFTVTFTAYKDTRWLYTTLKYLYEHAENLNDIKFGNSFLDFLETLSKNYAAERFCTSRKVDADKLRYDNNVPVFAFNFTDYVLWKNRHSLKSKFPEVAFDKFTFRYRRSIEHWYPQNRDATSRVDNTRKMDTHLLHSFANLAVIVASQNSKFSDDDPLAKLSNWRDIFPNQSLKLQIMATKTSEWREWDNSRKDEIEQIENNIISKVNQYMNNDTFPTPKAIKIIRRKLGFKS